jgi:hypothetical protein
MATINQQSTSEILDIGIKYLIEKMGIIEAERFISVLTKEKTDYTKWRQQYFCDVSSDEFHEDAVEYANANPF